MASNDLAQELVNMNQVQFWSIKVEIRHEVIQLKSKLAPTSKHFIVKVSKIFYFEVVFKDDPRFEQNLEKLRPLFH